MAKPSYWNDPQIADQRARELERALPVRKERKAKKAQEDHGATRRQHELERAQSGRRKGTDKPAGRH